MLLTCFACMTLAQDPHYSSLMAFSQKDTVKKHQFCFSFDGGISIPFSWSGYGSNSFYEVGGLGGKIEEVGFASAGIVCDATAKITLFKGWGCTLKGSYSHNPFDASGFLNENWDYYGQQDWSYSNNSFFLPQSYRFNISTNIKATGSYFYNNYSVFAGVNNITNNGRIDWEYHFSLGALFMNLPSLSGIATVIDEDTAYVQHTNNYTIKTNSYHTILPAIDIGGSIGIKVSRHIYTIFDLSTVVALTKAQFNIAGEVTNAANQVINPVFSSWTYVWVFNATMGVEYKF